LTAAVGLLAHDIAIQTRWNCRESPDLRSLLVFPSPSALGNVSAQTGAGICLQVSRFSGIVITMYFNDHHPPHFHVRYGEYRATVSLDPIQLHQGELPSRVCGLVMEWGQAHRSELQQNWTRMAIEGSFDPIPPLA
jgi:hypothetical protein